VEDLLIAVERFAGPVQGDLGEETILHRAETSTQQCLAPVGTGERRSFVKITERTYEKRTQALHR
jgi:hypothetical protein